jgi:4a-hydroxytetrahydrobiopterin dehydratase
MSALNHDEIEELLAALPGWHHRGNALEKHFDRGDFNGSMHFVNAIAAAANEQDHHPDMAISWNKVAITLCSHDVGGITARDFRLADTIEKLGAG